MACSGLASFVVPERSKPDPQPRVIHSSALPLKLRNHRALYSPLACHLSLPPWSPAQVRAVSLKRAAKRRVEFAED